MHAVLCKSLPQDGVLIARHLLNKRLSSFLTTIHDQGQAHGNATNDLQTAKTLQLSTLLSFTVCTVCWLTVLQSKQAEGFYAMQSERSAQDKPQVRQSTVKSLA